MNPAKETISVRITSPALAAKQSRPFTLLFSGKLLLGGLSLLLAGLALVSFSTSPALASPDLSSAAVQKEQISQLYSLVNQYRASHRLRRLRPEAHLARGAKAYSQKMVKLRFFSHTDPQGGDLEKRMLRSGYAPRNWIWGIGENLAWSGWQDQPAQHVFQLWVDSPRHRENMLLRNWVHMGAGLQPGNPYGGNLGGTWTIWFGEKSRF